MLRIAHLTDIHMQPEKGAAQGLEAALAHVQGRPDKPDLIFTGGDLVMDSLEADKHRTKEQWDLFQSVLKANLELPIQHCIGNHDVWGWENWGLHGSETKFGKQWAMEELQLQTSYRSFDQGGWHIVVLDSTHRLEGNGYTARLDDEQFEWLEGDLAATPKTTPVLVISHIPILSACAFLDGDNESSGDWRVPGAWMHIDVRRIKNLFLKHPNVKLCLSGHLHLIDEVLYNGVTYCCNGAVCAGWWNGDYQECTYGYGLVDLYDDGTFKNQYVSYDWNG